METARNNFSKTFVNASTVAAGRLGQREHTAGARYRNARCLQLETVVAADDRFGLNGNPQILLHGFEWKLDLYQQIGDRGQASFGVVEPNFERLARNPPLPLAEQIELTGENVSGRSPFRDCRSPPREMLRCITSRVWGASARGGPGTTGGRGG